MLGSRPAFIEIQERERDWRSLRVDVPAGDSLLCLEEEKEKKVDTCIYIYTHKCNFESEGNSRREFSGLIASGIAVRTADKNG